MMQDVEKMIWINGDTRGESAPDAALRQDCIRNRRQAQSPGIEELCSLTGLVRLARMRMLMASTASEKPIAV